MTLGKLHKLSNIQFPHLQNGANNSACFIWMLWESPVLNIQVLAQGLPKKYKYPLKVDAIIESHPLTLCELTPREKEYLEVYRASSHIAWCLRIMDLLCSLLSPHTGYDRLSSSRESGFYCPAGSFQRRYCGECSVDTKPWAQAGKIWRGDTRSKAPACLTPVLRPVSSQCRSPPLQAGDM